MNLEAGRGDKRRVVQKTGKLATRGGGEEQEPGTGEDMGRTLITDVGDAGLIPFSA